MALLERIIKASSNEGDVILDPFCGCAMTLVAADRLDRQWAGIDLSPLAGELVLRRISDDRGPLFDDVVYRADIPLRTDLGDVPRYNHLPIAGGSTVSNRATVRDANTILRRGTWRLTTSSLGARAERTI